MTATTVIGTLAEALGFEAENVVARELLADDYGDRYLTAEQRLDADDLDYLGKLVGQDHDGKYAEIGAGFVHVPAGPCIVGGDAEAAASLPRAEPEVDDFFIATQPVWQP